MKVGELEARLVLTTLQEVYDERQVKVQQVVEIMNKSVPGYDTLLANVVHTWENISEDLERVKVKAQMDELQRQQERLK